MAAEPGLFAQADIAAPEFRPGNLATKFLEPPFSVLDTRQGRWQDRRRSWLSLGITSELGRGADLLALSPAEGARARWAGDGAAAEEGEPQGGTSIFDPVLCELAYRWWAPEGGTVLDPFAGGSVRGIVAAKLGHPYTGVDLSAPQLAANREQAAAILGPGEPVPTWLHGDSRHLDDLLPAGELYDMVLSCPPYYDLEVYSDDPADLSTAGTYAEFLDGYALVLERAAARLHAERFLVLVVSEIRDKATGYFRGFVGDTVAAARAAGMHFYNDAVLLNSAGTLPLRVTKYMEAGRKLGRAHQNVLCFVKGSPPRGWSYDRAAPPSPQLGLGLEPEPEAAPAQATAGQAAEMAAGVAPEAIPPAAAAPGASQTPVLKPEPEPMACSRAYCILPAGHAMGHQLVAPEEMAEEPAASALVEVEGGWADPATGELFRAEPEEVAHTEPAEAAPEGGLEPRLQPRAGGMPEVRPASAPRPLVPAPMPEEEWRAKRASLWREDDPNRPCWTCGRPPTSAYRDGSPGYDHSHEPEVLTMFGGLGDE